MQKDYFMELSNFFSSIRKNRGYTMMNVSKGAEVSSGYLSDIENRLEERIGIPKKSSLKKLVDFYKLNEEEEEQYMSILLNLIISSYFTKEQVKKIKEKHKIWGINYEKEKEQTFSFNLFYVTILRKNKKEWN